jgi:hypothetical protein
MNVVVLEEIVLDILKIFFILNTHVFPAPL